jgi:hypothetical protein
VQQVIHKLYRSLAIRTANSVELLDQLLSRIHEGSLAKATVHIHARVEERFAFDDVILSVQ